jgi:type II secretory pathway component PulF
MLMKSMELIKFCRTLEVMVLSGIALHQAMNSLAESAEDKEAEIYLGVTRRLEQGASFSGALSEYPKHFPPFLIAGMRIGEQTGRLHHLLGHVGNLLERSEKISGKVRAALVYPASLLVLTLIIVLVVVFFVVPRQADFLSGMGADLPIVTRTLVAITEFALHPVVLCVLAVLSVSVFVFLRQATETKSWESLAAHGDRLILDVPGFGSAIKTSNAIRLLRGLSALLEAGASFTWALKHLIPTLDNRELRRRLKESIREITDGETPSNCFARHQVLPDIAVGLFAVGEEEGSLDLACRHAADLMESELNNTLDTLVSLLEPAAMLFMGVVVGFVILSTALPTVQLMQNL